MGASSNDSSRTKLARLTVLSCPAAFGLREAPLSYVLEPGATRASELASIEFLAAQPKPVEVLTVLRESEIVIHCKTVAEGAMLAYLSRRSQETRRHLLKLHAQKDSDHNIGVLVRASYLRELISLEEYSAWLGDYLLKGMGCSVSAAATDPDARAIGADFVVDLSPTDPGDSVREFRISIR